MTHEIDPERSIEEARLLLELSRAVSASLDLQDVLNKGLAALRRLIDFDGGSIQLIIDGALQLVAADPPAPDEVYRFRLPLGEGFGGRVAVTGEPIYSSDATVDPRAHPEGRAKASTTGVRSYFAAPLIERGAIIGIVQLDALTVDAFPPQKQALVLAFVPTIAAAAQNARLYEREVDALRELRAAERMKNDFLAMVSHELRTPLTSIIGFSETLAARHAVLDRDTLGLISQRLVRRSRSLMRLIEDLLDITTMERGALSVVVSAADLETIILQWADLLDDEGPLRLEIEPGLPLVSIDTGRFRQILDNLYGNARKFSPTGSEIVVRAAKDGDRVTISVVDHGKGIPAELQGRVFERFFQVEPATTRTTGGLGVGLYLVRLLCDRMDAAIVLDSEVGVGTTITIGIPVASEVAATA